MSQMRRLIPIATRAFLINLMLVLCLHVFPPIAFFCPLGTGFVTGWRMAASRREGAVVGAIMGCWMWVLCGVIALGVLLLFGGASTYATLAKDTLVILLLSTVVVGHLAVFAGGGAMIGGHLARRELAALGRTGTEVA